MRQPATIAGGRREGAVGGVRSLRRFAALFLGCSIGFFALYWISEALHGFRHVNVAHARVTAAALRGLGIGAEAHGTSIVLGHDILEIVAECTGIYVLILFAAGVVAFPTDVRARLRGLALGLPCIVAINFVRLVSLGLVVHFRPTWLSWFHEYLWQVLFVGLVATLFAVWVARTGSKHGSFAAR